MDLPVLPAGAPYEYSPARCSFASWSQESQEQAPVLATSFKIRFKSDGSGISALFPEPLIFSPPWLCGFSPRVLLTASILGLVPVPAQPPLFEIRR